MVFGAPAMRARVVATELKAAQLESRRRAVRDAFGDEAIAKVADALAGRARELWLTPPLTTAWHAIGPFLEIDRAILRVLLADDLDRLVALVTRQSEAELATTYRFLIRLGGPAFVLKRIGVALETKIRPGAMRLIEARGNGGVSEITGVALPPYVCQRTSMAWAGRALELAGARDVRTEHTACVQDGHATCRYTTTWRAS